MQINRRYNKLFLKAKYLSAELEEHNYLFEQYKKDFSEELSLHMKQIDKDVKSKIENCTKNLLKDLSSDSSSDRDKICEISKNNIHPDLKKIYRKIMLKIHPDKTSSIEDEDLKNKYSKLCSAAINAANESNWYMITDVAIELGIEISDISESHISGLTKSCTEYEKEIKGIKNTYPWVWANSNLERRKEIMTSYVEKV